MRITQLQQWGENFHAELICSSKAHPTRHLHREVRAHGPISACTQFLGDLGRYVEIQSFHQREIFSATVSMLKVRHQYLRKTAWAIGFGANPENSIATAMSCAAERIHS
ncbi:acetyl-CoA acetyltransferase [Corynebacterium sp. 3HC-13]|uniref:acetyl-CoA acetyltransferase n=1 Tax=Corynebacterium poyangense TaxID=2684405 RepID=UPI001CCF559E|nr:acetyl-CoA acetyltransferase [Corynebacterium poyangense]MBZ8176511.1 acetyl-CoA acetyltransferase [Corynebacterium poyangense]